MFPTAAAGFLNAEDAEDAETTGTEGIGLAGRVH
jgi:hypothetical protein